MDDLDKVLDRLPTRADLVRYTLISVFVATSVFVFLFAIVLPLIFGA